MKKALSALLVIVMLTAIIPMCILSASAADAVSCLSYDTINSTEVKVYSCNTDASGSVVIPNTYNGKKVTGIADCAFYECKKITNVTIPNSVTKIGEAAFAYCEQLEEITIPNSVTEIGKQSFWCCKSLKEIKVPGSVKTIEESLFAHCESLITAGIGSGVTTIGRFAFFNCMNLKRVELPYGVTTIGNAAFEAIIPGDTPTECDTQIEIFIPKTVTEIIIKGDEGDCLFSGRKFSSIWIYGDKDSFIAEYAAKKRINFSNIMPGEGVISDVTVKFVDYDGRVISEQTIPCWGDATKPANPKREGYQFIGWQDENGNLIEDFSNITKNMVLTAKYKKVVPVKYKVTFYGGENGDEVISEKELSSGSSISVPSRRQVRKVGKRFFDVFTGRWMDRYGNIVEPATMTVTSNVYFEAEYDNFLSYFFGLISGKY